MKTVSASEANRHFSQVLRQATLGETIVITSRGKAVATLGPARQPQQDRQAAKEALFARLREQQASGKRNWTRDELYENRA
jgi:prevent-host-death family protein